MILMDSFALTFLKTLNLFSIPDEINTGKF